MAQKHVLLAVAEGGAEVELVDLSKRLVMTRIPPRALKAPSEARLAVRRRTPFLVSRLPEPEPEPEPELEPEPAAAQVEAAPVAGAEAAEAEAAATDGPQPMES